MNGVWFCVNQAPFFVLGRRRKGAGRMILILNDLDDLLNTRREFMVGPWLAAARELGDTEEEKALCERNARAQITFWGKDDPGTDLRDYAHKEWGGLVRDVYLPRWTAFMEYQRNLMEGRSGKPLNHKAFEIEWGKKNNTYPVVPQGDTVRVAAKILDKWGKVFSE